MAPDMRNATTSASSFQLPEGTPPEIVQFWNYWAGLRENQHLPSLQDYFDHVPPDLQPYVVIVDIPEPGVSKIRLSGTELNRLTGTDSTGKPFQSIYGPKLLDLANKLTWEVVNRPVGYLSIRTISTTSDHTAHIQTINLPIVNRATEMVSFITFSAIRAAEITLEPHEHVHTVLGIELTQWIDLGAGVPDFF